MSNVKEKDTVKVHYTGSLEDGQVFDSSVQREPLEFTVGAGMVIPGFEEGVIGMEVSDKKTVVIPYEKAYGPERKELILDVPKTNLPEGLSPEVGMELVSKQPDGHEMVFRVLEIQEESVKVDANHPLAGKNLTFEIELVEII